MAPSRSSLPVTRTLCNTTAGIDMWTTVHMCRTADQLISYLPDFQRRPRCFISSGHDTLIVGHVVT